MMSAEVNASTPRALGNGRHSPTSPLKLFGQAKDKINNIFTDISSYVTESTEFLAGCNPEDGIVSVEVVEESKLYGDKVTGIKEMLSRDRMKVAFFGRTSNGKSTVINAMLKDKILPSGIGHTTSCFVQVEGLDGSGDAYITSDQDSDSRLSVNNLSQLASALSSLKLEPESIVRICWPKSKCNLLKDDVVLVDSPGIDVSPDLDTWIDKHCLDADVFVLVGNAESTLMQTEKNFFHKVSAKLSKPNIFILNNRWDASASEPEMMEQVKLQHMERSVGFLVEELHVCTKQEAENRVFFVSAREALANRTMNANTPTLTPSQMLYDGWQGRLFEFANFERKFEELISQSAVQTKFEKHTDNGKVITTNLKAIMEQVLEKTTTARDDYLHSKEDKLNRYAYIEQQLDLLTSEIKEKIMDMTDHVERKVSQALTEEIRRLSHIVDEFDRPFHPDPMLLAIYKKELHNHVEEGLGRNVQARCSSELLQGVDSAQYLMTERVQSLLPEDTRVQEVQPSQDFEVAYRLDCRNMCADFQEDISFRFSLGITSLMRRFLGSSGTKQLLGGYREVPRPLSSTPQTPSNLGPREDVSQLSAHDNEALLSLLSSFSTLYSSHTIGVMAVTGVIAKAAGWRVLIVTSGIYGIVYLYERLSWTRKAREREFKRQYVDYAGAKLRLIVDLTSANCSHQVQQELTGTFARLKQHVDTAKTDLKKDMAKIETELGKLQQVSTRSNYLKNKAVYLDSELNTFIHQYLLSAVDSRI